MTVFSFGIIVNHKQKSSSFGSLARGLFALLTKTLLTMASTTSLSDLVAIRDKLITAYKNLAQEGVSSYSIGDQTFTLKDTKDILAEIQQLDKLIALKDSTLGGSGRNRITLRNFNG